MTDTEQQTLPTAADSADNGAAGRQGAARPAAKRGSLSTMLLPELQQVAAGLGIRTTKMKKSDLIAAIQAARGGDAPANGSARSSASTAATRSAPTQSAPTQPEPTQPEPTQPEPTQSAPTQSAPTQSAPTQPEPTQPEPTQPEPTQSAPDRPARADQAQDAGDAASTRERPARRRARSAEGAPASAPAQTSAPVNGSAEAPVRPDTQRDDRQADDTQRDHIQRDDAHGDDTQRDGDQSDGQRRRNDRAANEQAGQQDGQGAHTQTGQNQTGQHQTGQNQGGQTRNRNQNNQNNQGTGQNRQNVQTNQSSPNNQGGGAQTRTDQRPDVDDDDFEGGRRRGRRYRDRRGRNRERQSGGQSSQGTAGGNDVEPTVSDDDVLVPIAGIVDAIEEKNSWFVRVGGYFSTSDDLFIATSMVRRYGLRRGDAITGAVRQLREGERREKYNPLVRLDTVNGGDPEAAKNRVEFTKLTPLYPQERLRLETEPHILTTRVIDVVMPIGKGQRALIVSPPKAGKTMVLQAIANAIATNNPEVHLMVVLIDERPEEVTDMQRSVRGEVIASTFDRRPQDHITVAELSIERAKRLVEMGHDVVVLLDSITRLGRAYNLGAPASGRILSGGVDSTALYPPKRFLGAARNIENGGSLTILATALVETGSAGDTVIFEEFKGTGNAELKLDRKIADKRTFPAVDVDQSSTRKEELLLSPDELSVTIKLRRVLHALDSQQGIELLLNRLRQTRTNREFLMQIAKTTPGQD